MNNPQHLTTLPTRTSADLSPLADLPIELGAPALLPVPSTEYAARWMLNFLELHETWSRRVDDLVRRGHPQQNWVQKQRAAHRRGELEEWQLSRFERIGFPLASVRQQAIPTNAEYAARLVDFYREHGHHAPTHTIGGNGITQWLAAFAGSKGRAGLSRLPVGTDEPADLKSAMKIITDGIPGFTFGACSKATLNRAKGLSHNGYKPSISVSRHFRTGGLTDSASERIRRGYGRSTMLSALSEALPGFQHFLQGATQGVRIQQVDHHGDIHWAGWLDPTRTQRCAIHAASEPGDERTFNRNHWHARDIELSPEFTTATYVLKSADGGTVLAIIDLALHDQLTMAGLTWASQKESLDFVSTMRVMTSETTANRAFAKNYADLATEIRAQAPHLNPIRITGLSHPAVGHMARKHERYELAPTHALLLSQLNFIFGKNNVPAEELFRPRLPVRTPMGSQQAATGPYDYARHPELS